VTQERNQNKLDLLVALGGPVLAVRGYASPEVGEIFTEADRLCREIGDSPRTFEAVQGLWAYFLVRGQLDAARSLAERLVQISTGQPSFELEGFLRLGITCSMLGQPVSALEHFEKVLRLHDPDLHRSNVYVYGQDPLVSCYCHLSVVLWLLGFPDQALTKSDAAIRTAKEVRHSFSLSWALLYSAIIHTLRRETEASNARATELADLSAKQAFAYRLAQARILKGWSISKNQTSADAAIEIRKGIQEVTATGAEVYLPYYLALAAECWNAVNDHQQSLRTIAHALEIITKTGERFYEAELYRLRGETLLSGPCDMIEAEASFLKALDISRGQRSKSLELRAATSLVRLRLSKGETLEARDMLARLLSDFSEGYESSDYLQAKQLLNAPR